MIKHLTAFTSLAILAACSGAEAPAEPDVKPGALLSLDDIAADALIPGAASGATFTYASTNGIDGTSDITVTGAIYLPEGSAPEGGWPLIAWSHGTVGVADRCAPSTFGRSERDRTYLEGWLSNGYAVVASDYQGLGGEGQHPYMAAAPMAYSNLDAIRAVQGGAFPVTDAVVVAGQSQGAAGAIATAGYHAAYAPDVDLKAISATGVPYFPPALQQAAEEADPTYQLYLMILAEELNSDFSFEGSVDPEVWPTASKAYDQCVFELYETVAKSGLTSSDITSPTVLEQLPIVFKALSYPTLTLPVPAFIGTGATDNVTPLPMQQLFVKDACAAGSKLEARVYQGADHNGGLLNSMSDAQSFVAKAFAGEELPGNCPAE